ncbi:MAG: PhzF family phenazine biosynthesis protein [Solirubrobacteraceae bacterium]
MSTTRTCSRRRRSSSRRPPSTTGSGSSRNRRATSTSTSEVPAGLSEHRFTWLDVFADAPLEGNGLAVVHDADDLDDATMLALARETRLSETTFVQRASESGADYRNRIFTLAGELAFAGHPSLGTAVAVARARGESQARFVQQTTAGLQPIEVRLDGDRAQAAMLQEPASFGPELDPADVLGVASLAAKESVAQLPPQPVSTGLWQLIAPLRSAAALARAEPDAHALAELSQAAGTTVLYLAHCPPGGDARARGFLLDAAGRTLEDPATGSAAGPLLAYLHRRTGRRELRIRQGDEMGRPSVLTASLSGDRVEVSGNVVTLVEGTLRL